MTGRGQSPEAKGHFFHVTHNKEANKWHVKEVKATDYESYDSKEEAIKRAEEHAKSTDHGHVVIHREDGKFDTIENF
ncbi:DUF2188 domain-containing protein [Candidatus Cardinium hertigii]|jgi:hypothetical protein|uniref:DUF2188 domain-containing protein n=1 Tax=Candidatus Cardinium hertigii TaxID=247481 RepID=A0A3N2QCW3_9BACT|nr:DUF2188 domain-containing protein [Candidatus Cardinium hertigii]ROT47519.1 DUF2188 domain-containing protein [Candidatus Cardinium hertigii]